MLHVTNGDSAVGVLRRAVEGEFLPWRDVLHEGPVHAGLPLDALSRRRAAFIASAGWASLPQIEKDFLERDAKLRNSLAHAEVVLWFEHDLYDQLQLIQVLDWRAASASQAVAGMLSGVPRHHDAGARGRTVQAAAPD